MSALTDSKTGQYSTVLTIIFLVCLMSIFAFSEIFKGQNSNLEQESLINNPIRADILANLKTFKIKNNLGSFTLSRDDKQWFLKEPRLMPANTKRVLNIIEGLRKTTVVSVTDKDAISLNNFALENPNLTVDLFSELDEQLKVQVGLVNPINNTSYITVSGNNKIYQVESTGLKLQSYRLSDFIDSSVFSTPLSKINRFKLYNRDYRDPTNVLTRGSANWKSKKYNSITKANVDKKLQKILDIRTYMIIDEENSELRTFIDNYFEKPLYRIEIKTDNKKIIYKISSLIKSIKELKLEKRQYFLMTASDRKYTYVIQKDFLKEFFIRYSDLK